MSGKDGENNVIQLTTDQLDQMIERFKGATSEEIAELVKEHSAVTDNEIKAIKKAVHEETRSAEAEFKAEKRNAIKRWGILAEPIYWAKERVPGYNLTNFVIFSVLFTTLASIAQGITASSIAENLKKTELGEIKASSPKTVINSGSYNLEVGQGPYLFFSNSLSGGLESDGLLDYGYNQPGTSKKNYFKLADDGNELHISLVEPITVSKYQNVSPFLNQADAEMSDYAVLIDKIDAQECAWSASTTYQNYTDIVTALSENKDKTIRIAGHWHNDGLDMARISITSTLFAEFNEQIERVVVKDNADLLNKLEEGSVDLAIFTETAGSFNGAITGSLKNVINLDDVNLVDLQPDELPENIQEQLGTLSYSFTTLSVPTQLTYFTDSGMNYAPVGTMCNEYIGIYGRNPDTINSRATAEDAKLLHATVRDIDVVKESGFRPFATVK